MLSFGGLLCFSTIAFAFAIPLDLNGPMMKLERRCTPIPYSYFIMCITSEIAVIPPAAEPPTPLFPQGAAPPMPLIPPLPLPPVAIGPPVGVIVGDGLETKFDSGFDLLPWLIEPDTTSDNGSELNASSDGPNAEQGNTTKDTTTDPPPSDAAPPNDNSATEASGEVNASTEGSPAA